MSDEVAIRVENLSKRYVLSHQRAGGEGLRHVIQEKLTAPLRWLGRKIRGQKSEASSPTSDASPPTSDFRLPTSVASPPTFEEFYALRDVSFEVKRGEVVGIIGRNGAGKSTLLKILSRITEPTSGRIIIEGRVASLLEVGTGFHPELTGRENIFLNGAILGMSRVEIKRKFDEIVAFAEIEKFLDTPVKRYSSGMYVRLAFSVAAHLEPEILIVDEVLSVGDVAFQRKCMDYMQGLVRKGITVMLVSHNMFAVKAMCRRALLLSAGRIEFDGPTEGGIELYERDSRLDADPWATKLIGEDISRWPIVIKRVETLDEAGEPRTIFNRGERMRVRIHHDVRRPLKFPNFCFGVRRSDNILCCVYSAARDGFTLPLLEDSGIIELLTPPLSLISELYGTHVVVWDSEFKNLYCGQLGPSFHVRDEVLNPEFGVFHEAAEWQWRNESFSQAIIHNAPTTAELEARK
jgi:lipopolysaccharide transport system ATP-binding protein